MFKKHLFGVTEILKRIDGKKFHLRIFPRIQDSHYVLRVHIVIFVSICCTSTVMEIKKEKDNF